MHEVHVETGSGQCHDASVIFIGRADCACDYTSLTTSLNSCVATASGSSDTKWFLPYGTLAQQAEFCTTAKQSALQTCINSIFSACKLDAKSVKMFSTTGDNLVTAYSNVCASSIAVEAQACMSVVSPLLTFTTAETAFKTAVTSLPSAATSIEICGLATTMKYTAYTEMLTVTCTDSTHLAVWGTFYDEVMNTYLCTTCSASITCYSNFIVLAMLLLPKAFAIILYG